MELLILGGTRFAGRWLAEQAMAAGHRVTLMHRGRTDASALPEAEHLIGDRDGGLAVLGERRWDAVVDTSGYVPRVVRASAEALKGRVGAYLFVSSISVYAEPVPAGFTENHALAILDDPTTEEFVGPAYGGLKVLCEGVVRDVLGDRAVIVRPGVIAGPRDYMDRFAYWVRRVAKGGDVLAPGDPGQGVQFVDARDVAAFYLDLITHGVQGVFQVTGPQERLSMRAFLESARDTLGGDARFTWVDEAFLLAEGV
ncbi:MAG: NAD-dependent epimerase/dehydratase family protein, partial [Candidatus Eisenbacteria bacterium]